MRVKNQEISDAILKYVNKYFHENRKAPTISVHIAAASGL